MVPVRAAAWAVVLAVVAGCFGDAPEFAVEAERVMEDLTPPLPTGFEYACPPGGAAASPAGPCVASIVSLTESNQEPYLAIHPRNPDVMAIGVNAGHTVGALSADRSPPGLDVIRVDIFVTEDGGSSWYHTRFPAALTPRDMVPIQPAAGAGDPALAFDEDGTLHVSALVTGNVAYDNGVAYASSRDLGRTWSDPTVWSDEPTADRNWITAAPGGLVLVPWQVPGRYSRVAWSRDGGVSWSVQANNQVASDCITVSPVVVVEERSLFACSDPPSGAGDSIVKVFEFDARTGDIHLVGSARLGGVASWPHLVVTSGGRLVMSVHANDTEFLLASDDGGATWSGPLDFSGLLSAESTDPLWFYWGESDPWGGLHYLLAVDFSVVHVVLDPADFRVISERQLRGPMGEKRVPGSAAPEWGDHFYGIAFHEGGGVLVWTRDKGLDWTLLRPVFGNVTAGA